MKNPENLPQVTERALYGLKADESLKQRILQKAVAEPKKSGTGLFSFRPVPVLCALVVIMALAVLFLNGKQPLLSPGDSGDIMTFAAGDTEPAADAE